ncbi:MAG: PAS domain S-box protein [bacterium]
MRHNTIKSVVNRKTSVMAYSSQKREKPGIRLILLCLLLAVWIFALDLQAPLVIAGGIPYIIVVLVSLWSPKRGYLLAVASVCSVLTVLGFLFSFHGSQLWIILVNCFLALVAIWITVGLTLKRTQAVETLFVERDRAQKYLQIAGVMFVALDRDGMITMINQKGCAILGYREEELLGRDWFRTCVPVRLRSETIAVFQRLMAGKEQLVEYYDNPVLTKSGEERFISWHNTVLRDLSEIPTGTLSSGLDITERLQAEKVIHESEARLRAILDTAVEGIITIDKQGIVQSFNKGAEQIFGYRADEMVGKNVSLIIPAPHHDKHDSYIMNYLETGVKRIIGIGREITGMRKDGTLFPLAIAVSEVKLGDRSLFTGILHDITEQKILEKQVVRAERLAMIGKMAAKVAHEVRNPLSSISLNAELLEDELERYESVDAREAKSLLNSMIREIDRVTSLTDEYLQYSRLPESLLVKRNFQQLINEIEAFLGNELKQKNIELQLNGTNQPLELRFDRTQFRRVLLNIIRNAIEAMPDGGQLKIWSERKDNKALINIQDTGIGIPAEQVENIFDPFFTTKDFGTGLGLAITQQIVHEHGGEIYCNSKQGQGTTFCISLPLDDHEREDSL